MCHDRRHRKNRSNFCNFERWRPQATQSDQGIIDENRATFGQVGLRPADRLRHGRIRSRPVRRHKDVCRSAARTSDKTGKVLRKGNQEVLLDGHAGRRARGLLHAYTRALDLCKESGLDEHILPAVFGLWTWNFVRASLGEAQALAEHLLKSAENADSPVYSALAREALGFTLFAQGRFTAAHAELGRSMTVPCGGPWRPVVSLVELVASANFRRSSLLPKMVSFGSSFVSSAIG